MTDYLNTRLDDQQLHGMSVLGLAHVGDAVYELLVRSWLSAGGRTTAQGLHRATVRLVCATAQAKAAQRFLPELTQEELAVFRRGRNAKVNSVPKHSEISDYHAATGLETLFGYLYLKGDKDRINRLFELSLGTATQKEE